MNGVRIDYLAPTIYLLDLLLIVHLLASLYLKKLSLPRGYLIILPLLLTNLIISDNPTSSLFWLLRFSLYVSFIWSQSATYLRRYLAPLFTLVILFQVALGSYHVVAGSSLQGIFYWLGERALNLGSPNVAKSELFGETILRPYGTFSHPNTYAGWLTVAILMLGYASNNKQKFIYLMLAALGIVISGSRAALATLLFMVLPNFARFLWTRLSIIIFSLMIVLTLHFSTNFFTPARSVISSNARISLLKESLILIHANPILGVGANASIGLSDKSNRELLREPDHNSITLVTSWFGLLGLTWIIFATERRKLLTTLTPLTIIILLDHYFLTSPQGLFAFLLYYRARNLE